MELSHRCTITFHGMLPSWHVHGILPIHLSWQVTPKRMQCKRACCTGGPAGCKRSRVPSSMQQSRCGVRAAACPADTASRPAPPSACLPVRVRAQPAGWGAPVHPMNTRSGGDSRSKQLCQPFISCDAIWVAHMLAPIRNTSGDHRNQLAGHSGRSANYKLARPSRKC